MFPFRPISVSIEPTDEGTCVPVLYARHIPDIIDFSLRSCVERNITVRRCKNCGRYFAQTGRVSAEYCDRPVPRGQQKCREIGAFQQWTLKQSDDPVFKAYRREYKRRFAWIKAAASATVNSTPGVNRPENRKRNATGILSLWKNSSSG